MSLLEKKKIFSDGLSLLYHKEKKKNAAKISSAIQNYTTTQRLADLNIFHFNNILILKLLPYHESDRKQLIGASVGFDLLKSKPTHYQYESVCSRICS